MFIVSDELLERLICSQCKKYLSVKNVKVYPNRGIKCGRCSNASDAGVVSLFGILAEQALFRCVNRFEGCNQLLSYSDVAEHEKICVSQEYDCPCCVEPFKGSAYEIYLHFKEQHADLLLVNTPEFTLEVDNELIKTYLYRKNDLLFFVNARYTKFEDELILNVMYLGADQDASKISQMFTLHSLDGKLKYKTKRKSCCSVTGGNLKCFKIDISTAVFSKDVIICRFDLNTENVDNLVALPENFKKIKSDLEDKDIILGGSILKPSVFPTGFYPVMTFNPTTSESKWGFPPTPTVVSTTSSVFSMFDPLMASIPSNQPTTTTTTSIFSKSFTANPFNRHFNTGFQPPITTSTTLPVPAFGVSTSSNQPVTVTTVSSTAARPTLGRSSVRNSNNSAKNTSSRTFCVTPNGTSFSPSRTGIFGSRETDAAQKTNIFGANTFGTTPRSTGS